MAEQKNLTDSLSKLEEIVNWFDKQEEVDVEQGLTKVKTAASLIKDSKKRLAEIENEFQSIEKEINDDDDIKINDKEMGDIDPMPIQDDDRPVDLSEIPF